MMGPIRMALVVALAATMPGTVVGQRTVTGTEIQSDTLPAASIRFDTTLAYLGTQTIALGSGTMAEQHFFVDADGTRVKRIYWVQFEGRSAGRPYDYSSDVAIDRHGVSWRINHRFYGPEGFAGPMGSDGEQAYRFLRGAGYRLGSDLMRVRLVWLLDEPAMHELMIIYVEDLSDHGLSRTDLASGARWASERVALTDRALGGLWLDHKP